MTEVAAPLTAAEERALELVRFVRDLMVGSGRVATPLAESLAQVIVEGIRAEYGGRGVNRQDLYIPAPNRRARIIAARAEYKANGGNLLEICRKFRISERTARRFIRGK